MTDGYDRLVNPWSLQVETGNGTVTQPFRPLIDELTDLVRPSIEARGGGGSASTRNLVDVSALDLLAHIQDVTLGWLREWNVPGSGNTRADIVKFHDWANILHDSGAVETSTWERLAAYPETWAQRIWDYLEPPLQRPLRDSACPRCGVRKITVGGGDTADALVLERRFGQEVTAMCRADGCTATWVGEDGLKSLGRELGIEFNTDALTTDRTNGGTA